MTLTLEQVRQTRFHLARRNGYEPVDVDNFVDKVEATLTQLSEENSTLKQQIDALSSSEPSSIFVPGDPVDSDKLKADLQGSQSDLEGLRGELAKKSEELGQRQQELEAVRAELDGVKAQLEADAGRAARSCVQAASRPRPRRSPMPPKGRSARSRTSSSPAPRRPPRPSPACCRWPPSRPSAWSASPRPRPSASSPQPAPRRRTSSTAPTRRPTSPSPMPAPVRTASSPRPGSTLTRSRTTPSVALTPSDGQADARRAELFTALEQERDLLRGKVDHLRSFESTYRNNLAEPPAEPDRRR